MSILALRLTLETRECRPAMFNLVFTFALWGAALAIDYAWIPSGEHRSLVAASCRLAGQAMLIFSIGLYARHVLLDAEGLLPERQVKPQREKRVKKTKVSNQICDDSENGKSLKVDSAHKNSDKRTDLQPHTPVSQPSNRGPLASRVASAASTNAASASSASSRSSRYDDDEIEDDNARRPLIGDDDDDDDSNGGRKMSRAERKKLRKMQRQQRDDD